MSEVEHQAPSQGKLGEGPLGRPAQQAHYWLDIERGRLYR